MKFNYILAFAFTLILFSARGQQDAQFSDYKLNMSSFNPAFAGFFDGSVLLIHRTQFTGFKGAPESKNLNVNIPLTMNMGAGINVSSEKIGVTEELVITGDYSYTIFTDEINMLSFGLKAGFNMLNVDYTLLDLQNNNDLSFENNIVNRISPRIGVGFLFNTPKWFIGISTPNFIKESYDPTVKGISVTKPQIYFTTGYQTALTDELLFKPSILAKEVQGSPLAIDFALNFEFKEKFRFGTSYRWKSAITGIVGVNVLPEFQAGYAYDHNINGLGKYAPSSHQFYIKYTFKQSKNMRRDCGCSFTDPINNIGF
ncbi:MULTISPECIES: type IX secretion system membrane protein PorP/SprF [unclassified Flavobacterium]|uniref:PorP/SprF family type IX secretion system membrane protein n=1 Tax=unclassified Flavobacterium TaxID=196869 RepID=UPI000F0C6A42|nr:MULTISPECIES: type IX secretion system membrane protein PorP/SprF [unclassified Flavobacterium]AYN04022.1 type IX secretion system membrane protein PorP/SprF [Flavobacterium sp. 140616W15]MCD0476482.1 type IX secretion system membrane protein PorP/SprF [Flavobacterium sp. EDS]